MKRYYLSKIKLVQMPGGIEAWTHRAAEFPELRMTGAIDFIDVDPNTGVPTQKAVLCMIDAIDHREYARDPELADFPDGGLDVKVASIGAAARTRSQAKMGALGFTGPEVDAVWQGVDGMRDVINRLGRLNNPDFDALNFDTPD